MSQHNIIGSEAFDRKPFILVQQFRAGGKRRRKAGSTLALILLVVAAVGVGAVVAVMALAPQLADAQTMPPISAGLSAPDVPGTSSLAVPTDSSAPAPLAPAPVAPAPVAPAA